MKIEINIQEGRISITVYEKHSTYTIVSTNTRIAKDIIAIFTERLKELAEGGVEEMHVEIKLNGE